MTATPLGIRLEHCGKHFPDGTQALTPLDLAIHPGETLVLLGPSGCGKTTMLRLIAGLERPDAGGRILFGARDVTALPIEKRRVGMVFQSYALFPNMSVRGNIEYGLRVRGDAPAQTPRQRG
ncbi:ATP-binding cassette domain-containing protein [Elstera litoralis]|uniref:ATP-binding cassette domain-containing protein n=1 Tax=Elstera litoralis TaxID=552518 RepID=UPI000ACEC910|nr:ATP-binding cassette domain-containing protein [Elstera litoralis]